MPAPKRLLYLVTEDWVFWSHRLAVARAARDAGYEVHVAVRVTAHRDRIAREGFRLHPLTWRRSSRNPLRELRAILALIRLYWRVRPDIVHQVALKPVLYGSLAGWLTRVPATINALTGMGSLFTDGRTRRPVLRALVQIAFRMLLRGRRRWLVVQNGDDAGMAERKGFARADRLRLIPGSGVDPDRFAVTPEPAGPPIVAALVSRLLWDKGIGETVEAAKLLRDRDVPVRIRIVGDPDPENPSVIDADTVAAWRAEGIVDLPGRSDDIPAVWRDAHIAVLPSYREGMPRALLEAAAAGRPLIATDVPGCRDLVRDGENGLLVPARNGRALAEAIAALARDGDKRRAFGAAARRDVETRLADGPINAAFLDLYREAVAD